MPTHPPKLPAPRNPPAESIFGACDPYALTLEGSKLTRAGIRLCDLPEWHPQYVPDPNEPPRARVDVLAESARKTTEAKALARVDAMERRRAIRKSIEAERRLKRPWGWLMRELLKYDARERDVEEWRRGARGKAKAIIEGRTPWPRELLIWRGERESALIFRGEIPPWLSPRNLTKPQRETMEIQQ